MSHPSSLIDPFAVARHPQLEPEVKRAILSASWASDRSAVEGQPALRARQAHAIRLPSTM
jgi:hypothetical protein